MNQNGFRFAHLSDPHLATLDHINWRLLANKRILGYLSWTLRRRRVHRRDILEAVQRDIRALAPEHIVVTGDLTQIGTPAECRQALPWLQALGAADAVTLIPGNHDRYVAAPWAETAGLWQANMLGDSTAASDRDGTARFPFVRRRGPVAFIGLCSAVPSPPFFASGRVGTRQLSELGDALAELGRAGLFRIVLIHHGPLRALYPRRRGLDDAEEFRDIVNRNGAELILHGHGHERHLTSLPGTGTEIPVLGVPSASAAYRQAARQAGYNLCSVAATDGGWILKVRERRLDPGRMILADGDELQWEFPRTAAPA